MQESTGRGRPAPAWDLTNEEFRVLVERALLADDSTATDRLTRYFLHKIHRKARTFPPEVREDRVRELLIVAFRVSRRTLENCIESPRNYVIKAISYAYIDELRRAAASLDAHDHYSRHDKESHQRDIPGDSNLEDEIVNRRILSDFKRASRGNVMHKVAEVIEVSYFAGCSDTDACELLDFTAQEKSTVLRTIRRWRANRQSPLYDLTLDDEEN